MNDIEMLKSPSPAGIVKLKKLYLTSMIFKNTTENPMCPDVMDVLPEDVLKNKSSLMIVDVRQPDEFTGPLGHIPGARLVVLSEIAEHVDSLPKDKPIVFVCRSGGRSAQATAYALDCGYENVYNMKGGMLLWNECGYGVEK